MARVISVVLGLVLMGLGVWAVVSWWASVLLVLRAAVAITAVLLGVGIFVFGLSDLWTGQPKRAAPPVTTLPEGPGEPA